MNVIIQIQGRAAVPVRAIPLMSYWTVMAGAELVGIFLKNGKVGEVQRLTAYQLVGGVVSPISANYWADAEIALESLSETMKAKKYSYREWQLRVLQELPDVGFVWLDELEPYFAQLCDADNDSAAEYFQTLGPEKNLVPAMLGLDYTPLTSTELELVVKQGFQFAVSSALPAAPNSTEAGGTAPAQNPATPAPVVVDEIDFTMLATRKELIDAFGKFTGMSMSWFDNLTDAPKLKAARKCTGKGGRQKAEPLFCPYEVMQWLADPKRKKGEPLSDTTAWRLLKGNFGKVYNQYSIGDPNAD